jgi:hypothetical protein
MPDVGDPRSRELLHDYLGRLGTDEERREGFPRWEFMRRDELRWFLLCLRNGCDAALGALHVESYRHGVSMDAEIAEVRAVKRAALAAVGMLDPELLAMIAGPTALDEVRDLLARLGEFLDDEAEEA